MRRLVTPEATDAQCCSPPRLHKAKILFLFIQRTDSLKAAKSSLVYLVIVYVHLPLCSTILLPSSNVTKLNESAFFVSFVLNESANCTDLCKDYDKNNKWKREIFII